MTDVDEIELRLKKYSFDTKNLLKFKVNKINLIELIFIIKRLIFLENTCY